MLSGAYSVDVPVSEVPGSEVLAISEVAALRTNLARIESELSALKAVVAKLCAELGIRA
jgi:hypothetical protein